MTYQEIMEAASSYVATESTNIDSANAVANLMRPLCQALSQEVFFTITLDTKHNVIAIHETTRGLLDRSYVHAREVFRQAIIDNASRVVFCHNHPSGDPSPSTADISSTKALVAAGKIIGIEVLDHIIIGAKTDTRPKDYISFKEENML